MAKRYLMLATVAAQKNVTRGAITAAIERGEIAVEIELIGPDGKVRAQGISEEVAESWTPTSHLAGTSRNRAKEKNRKKRS